ncbi:hypothetical protein [Ramlibacter sp. AN1133]|uniref:hypothetical protein n=1 Tax=Ramlibacter sp. AN1133 TaxID=3133429 RepID=UPI0030BD635A
MDKLPLGGLGPHSREGVGRAICARSSVRDRCVAASTGENPAPESARCASAGTLAAVETGEILARAHYWAYRLGAFFILNVLDDPAWLALIFC